MPANETRVPCILRLTDQVGHGTMVFRDASRTSWFEPDDGSRGSLFTNAFLAQLQRTRYPDGTLEFSMKERDSGDGLGG